MTPSDFKTQWTASNANLICFPAEKVSAVNIPAEAKSFLTEIGLPAEAAPFLTFGSRRELALPTITELWGQRESYLRYRVLGSNGFGDPICLDETKEGRVVYLIPDDDMAVEFINSSVPQLAYSLLAFREAVDATEVIGGKKAYQEGRIPDVVAEQFIREMEAIDSAAIQPGTFWLSLILNEGI